MIDEIKLEQRSNYYKILNNSLELFQKMFANSAECIQDVLNETRRRKKSYKSKLNDVEVLKRQLISPLIYNYKCFVRFYTSQSSKLFKKGSSEKKNVQDFIENIQNKIDSKSRELNLNLEQVKKDLEEVLYTKKEETSYVYIGEVIKDEMKEKRREGLGTLTNGKEVYKGEFVQDLRHGFGIQVFGGGVSFKGEWKDDLPMIGIWKDQKSVFYGYVNQDENWKIGEFLDNEFDSNRKKNDEDKGFSLYYKDKATGLGNIKIDQDLDVEVMRGERGSDVNSVARIDFVNGVSYNGGWKNFKPNLIGSLSLPVVDYHNEIHSSNTSLYGDKKSIKILSYEGKFFAIESFEITKEFPLLSSKEVEIKYLDGSYFKGYIDHDYRFIGQSNFYIKNIGDKREQDFKGIFSSLDGLIFPLGQKPQKIPLTYLQDTMNHFESVDAIEPIEIEIWNNSSFTGCWVEFWPHFGNEFIVKLNGAIYSNKFDFKQEKGMRVTGLTQSPREKTFNFINGDEYQGETKNTEDSIFFCGFGSYKSLGKKVRAGFWYKETLVLDFSLVVGEKSYWLSHKWNLIEGQMEVEFLNGLKISGYWIDFCLHNGKIVSEEKVVNISSRKEFLRYMEENYSFISFKAPYEYICLSEREMARLVKEKARNRYSVNKDKLEEYLSHSQKDVMKMLKRFDIVRSKEDSPSSLIPVFNTTPGMIRDVQRFQIKSLYRKKGNSFISSKPIYLIPTLDDLSFMQKKTALTKSKVIKAKKKNNDIYDMRFNLSSQNPEINILDETLKESMKVIDESTTFKTIEPAFFTRKFNTKEKIISFFEENKENLDKLTEMPPQDSSDNRRAVEPYIQITESGLLKSTIDLFPALKQNTEFFKIDAEFWEDFKFRYLCACHEMLKLNGIKLLTNDGIMFFNGERYYFNNSERNSDFSLGLLLDKKGEAIFAYWSRFLYACRFTIFPVININDCDGKEYENFSKILELNRHLMGINKKDIDNMNRKRVNFLAKDHMGKDIKSLDKDGIFCYDGEWFNCMPFGNGKVSWNDNTTGNEISVQGFWFENQIYSDTYFNSIEFKNLVNEFSDLEEFENLLQEQLNNFLKPLKSIEELIDDKEDRDFVYSIKKFNTFKKRNYSIIINNYKLENMQQFCIIFFGRIKKIMDARRSKSGSLTPTSNMKVIPKGSQLDSVVIKYPNGDSFFGSINKYGFKVGGGKYIWDNGFIYKGKFFANRPYGYGKLLSPLGIKRSGFFFNGYLIKTPFGVDQFLKSRALKGIDGSVDLLAVKIAKTPLLGEHLINKNKNLKYRIHYDRIFSEIQKSKLKLRKDMEDVNDGELDYEFEWKDLMSDYVKKQIFINKSVENYKEVMKDASKEEGLDKQGLFKKSKTNFFKQKEEIMIKRLSKLQKEMVIELFRDNETEEICNLWKSIEKSPQNIKAFFNIKSKKKRNFLHITGHLGHRSTFVDLLTFLIHSDIGMKEKISILKVKDIDDHDIFDLICIKGFEVDNSVKYFAKFDYSEKADSHLLEYIEEDKDSISEFTEVTGESRFNGPKIVLQIEHYLRKKDRCLFEDGLIENETVVKDYENILNSTIKTSKMFLMTNRSICLTALLKSIKILERIHQKSLRNKNFDENRNDLLFDFLRKIDYDKKKNNPLYFSLYWGDLHTTLILLRERPSMIFWENPESQDNNSKLGASAPQVIKKSGENIFKARAIFGSVLNETIRFFNFAIIEKILKEKVLPNYNKNSNKKREFINIYEKIESKRFNLEENPLYNNDYILLSDGLCRQYLRSLKNISEFNYFKKKGIENAKYAHNDTPGIEAMQRNFFDFYSETDFEKKELNDDFKEIRNDVKLILCWYVYIFGNAEINPEIYQLLKIDPFELVLDQKNIFHFICMNNAYPLLKRFLNFFEKIFKKIHGKEKWKKEFLEKLQMGTGDTLDSPAHISVIYNSIDCLEVLVSFGVDIDNPNLRGRTVRELLMVHEPFNLEAIGVGMENFESQLVEYLRVAILSACKEHSIKYEFLDGSDKNFMDVLTKSDYELKQNLKKVKKSVISKMKEIYLQYSQARKTVKKRYSLLNQMLKSGSDIEKITSGMIQKKINKVTTSMISLLRKKKKGIKSKPGKFLDAFSPKKLRLGTKSNPSTPKKNKESFSVLNNNLLGMILNSDKAISITNERVFKALLSTNHSLSSLKYKYKRIEKINKITFLKKLRKIDYRKPLDPELKFTFPIDSLFCIEIVVKETDKLENHIVIQQINNIKKKYEKYGGAIRIEIIKGYEATGGVLDGILTKNKVKMQTYYILMKLTDSLLQHVAIQGQINSFNMKENFSAPFIEGEQNKELAPLRNYQKVNIMMKLLRSEFNIDMYEEKKILVKYFPIHNYLERENFKKTAMKSFYYLLVSLVNQSKNESLKIFTHLTFYHGIQQGFYFAFFSHYTANLVYLVVMGTTMLFFQEFYNTPLMQGIPTMLVGIWSTWMMNMWGRREKMLAYNFDISEEKKVKEIRNNYTGKAVIDEATFKISKKSEQRLFFSYMLTISIFILGIIPILICQYAVDHFIEKISLQKGYSETYKLVLETTVTSINGILNFITSLLYNSVARWAVGLENHAYDESLRKSLIIKRVTFRIFATVFTPAYYAVTSPEEKKLFSLVMNHLITYAGLNVGLNFGVPYFFFALERYERCGVFSGLILFCKSKRKGRLDKDREILLNELYSNQKTRKGLVKYIFGDDVEAPPTCYPVSEIEKNKTTEAASLTSSKKREKKEEVKLRKKINKLLMLKRVNKAIMKSGSNISEKTQEDKNLAEKESEKGRYEDHINIMNKKLHNKKMRLRERKCLAVNIQLEYVRYVLQREKIIETSYMLDLASAEEQLHTTLLTQYTFICFFVTQFPYGGLLSFLINIVIMFITILMYSYVTRRTICERSNSLGIWKSFYDLIGYLGIVFNAIALTKSRNAGTEIIKEWFDTDSTFLVYSVQNALLIAKFMLSILVPQTPVWVYNSLVREEQSKNRNSRKKAGVISRLVAKEKEEDVGDDKERSMFEDPEHSNLKFFFDNQKDVSSFGEGTPERMEGMRAIDIEVSKSGLGLEQ